MTQQPEDSRRKPTGTPEAAQPVGEPFVIRDRRRVNRGGSAGAGQAPAGRAPAGQASADRASGDTPAADRTQAEQAPAAEAPADREAAPEQPAPAAASVDQEALTALANELAAVRSALEERTEDLKRVTAEYHNYRKRVDRDRALVGEQATAAVLAALLPVLDDFDRARDHGELPEGVLAVVDHLTTTLGKFGLSAFGEKGDRFDPNWHEAVAHQTSADVTEPTCVDVFRRGYRLGDRVLRPAMVAVADPE